MRITKKMLKTAVNGFNKRRKELCTMTQDQLVEEYKRCFPHALDVPGTYGELLSFMLSDLMDLCIPMHWYQ